MSVIDITADPLTPVVDEEDIGVIAPYKAQVRTIRELLKLAKLGDVSVGSVEQFQGQVRELGYFQGREVLILISRYPGTEGDHFCHDPK